MKSFVVSSRSRCIPRFSLMLVLVAMAIFSSHCNAQPDAPAPIACASSTVSFVQDAPLAPSLACGGDRLILRLESSSGCPLNSGGILICDYEIRNCVSYEPTSTQPNGPIIWDIETGPAIDQLQGQLIITATYRLGPYSGTISRALNKDVCPPSTEPIPTPLPSPHTPVPCDSNTVSFTQYAPEGPLLCGGQQLGFQLSTSTTGCGLSSGGVLVCDFENRNCIPFTPLPSTNADGPVVWDIQTTSAVDQLQGPLIVTCTYQVGPFTGTISRAVDKEDCPLP